MYQHRLLLFPCPPNKLMLHFSALFHSLLFLLLYAFIVREDMSGILILWDFHIRSSLTSGIASLKVKLKIKYFHRCQFLFSP